MPRTVSSMTDIPVLEVRQVLHRLGGVGDRVTLVTATSREAVRAAVAAGEIVRDGRGRYALPTADEGRRAANALSGVVSYRSAALLWGWEVKTVPLRPDVTVPRRRTVPADVRTRVAVHWADLAPTEVVDRCTSPTRTLVDCLRSLPFDEALAIADSALRHEGISRSGLVDLAGAVRGAGAAACRRAAGLADARAANPVESVLRAIAIDVPGLDVVPQVLIRERNLSVRPDLVDRRRRLVLEADSFSWHGDRTALRWDARRYNALVVRGWRVLRFAWEDVMHDPDHVRATLTDAAELVRERIVVGRSS